MSLHFKTKGQDFSFPSSLLYGLLFFFSFLHFIYVGLKSDSKNKRPKQPSNHKYFNATARKLYIVFPPDEILSIILIIVL